MGNAPSNTIFYFCCLFFFSLRNVGQTWAATISDALFSTMMKIVVIIDDLLGQTRAATFFLSSIILVICDAGTGGQAWAAVV